MYPSPNFSRKGAAIFSLFRPCPVMLSFLCPLNEINLKGEWAEGREKLSKYSYQLMTRGRESSFDLICPSAELVLGIVDLGNSLGTTGGLPHCLDMATKAWQSLGIVFGPHTATKSQSWNPSPPALSPLHTTEGLLAFLLLETEGL